MYPVSLGYGEAVKRIRALLKNGHSSEALLTCVFTIEKTAYRTLRMLVVSAGFPSVQADILMKSFRGFENIKGVWQCFDPAHEGLAEFIPATTLLTIKKGQEMRNKLVHGSRVYPLSECSAVAKDLLTELSVVRGAFESRYGYDGWTKMKVRKKSRLHADPRVAVPS